MNLVGGKATEPYWLYALAGALLTGGPVWHYLYVNHYPFARPEAWVLPLVAGAVGATLALAAHRLGGLLETLCFGALLYLFADTQFDLHLNVKAIVLIAACLALAAVARARRATLTSLMLVAFYLAALPRPARARAPSDPGAIPVNARTLPPLVHLVLDEQWGVGGLRAEGDSATATFLSDFYRQRGFEVYDGAYSRFGLTLGSLPQLVSLGQTPQVEMLARDRQYRMRSNPYFERLRAMGYEIRVYESSLLDYCRSEVPVVSCTEAPGNSIANIGYLRGPWLRRASLAGRYFLNVTSHLYGVLHQDDAVWRRSVVGGGLWEAEQLKRDISKGPVKGTAYFAHILLPHAPFEVDAQCRAYADLSKRVGYERHARLSSDEWRARLALYAAQTRCTHRAVAEIIAALDSAAGREGSIVIVHGDHGARMSQDDMSETRGLSAYGARRLNASYSTLLAVRLPGVPPTIRREAVPVQDYFWALARGGFAGPVKQEWQHYVRLMPSDSAGADTLRTLVAGDMLWAR